MDKNKGKTELSKPEGKATDPSNDIFLKVHVEETQELPPIIINTDQPCTFQIQNALAGNVPLFIKKLWKMVNDDHVEEIISWNTNGDGFVIHDQLKFVSVTLPKYFKHNHLSSFVRQLNLYDFHKTHNVDNEDFQFNHPFFLKDLPQLLTLIKRKQSTGRYKATTANTGESSSSEVQEVMDAVKDIKTKNDVITTELSNLRQENAAIWGEINTLRVKYSKQTKIINKLIHFLISYMQKHHHARKTGRTVSTGNANKYLKTGPKIMELDYRYRNNPHDFWTEFDNQHRNNEHSDQEAYTVVEPSETNIEPGSEAHSSENVLPNITLSSPIEELLPGSSAFTQAPSSSLDQTLPQIDYSLSQPSSSKGPNSALQRAGGSKPNLGLYIDNSQMELSTIKELIKNLTPEEMASFYKLVNDNYKNQEEDFSEELGQETDELENELIELAELVPLSNQGQTQASGAPLEINKTDQVQVSPTNSNVTVQNLSMPFESNENVSNIDNISQSELLNPDDLLNNVSVDQYFNFN